MSTLLLKVLVWAWVVGLGVLAAGFLAYGAGDAAIFEAPALMALAMGALIVTRVRGNLVGAVLLIGGSAWLLYAVGYDYARLSLESGSLPGDFIAAWLGAWAGPLFYLSFPTLLLLFPDGRASVAAVDDAMQPSKVDGLGQKGPAVTMENTMRLVDSPSSRA